MGRLAEAWRRLRGHLDAAEVERALADDVEFHLERETEENLRRGMSPEEARRAARLSFGSIEAHKEAVRDEVRLRWLEDLAADLRFGLRMLRRAPVFTAVAIGSLALGIGANTAIFSVVHAVLLRPLPYPEAGRLVSPRIHSDDGAGSTLSIADFTALRDGVPALAALGVFYTLPGGAALTGEGEPQQVRASAATSGVFAALGVEPALGRGFEAADDAEGAEAVVLLAHGFWRDRFAASRDVLGRRIELDGETHAVVGVMPEGFHLPGRPRDQLWPVLQLPEPEVRAPFWLHPIGRLASGASPEQAHAQVTAVAAAVKSRYPDSPPQWRYRVEDLKETVVRGARARLLVLLAAVGLVLALAVINVANLLLARITARVREFALRSALGARRRRLVRQMVAESLLLVIAGGAAGLALAWLGVPLLRGVLPDIPRLDELSVDATVLAFTFAATFAAGLLVCLVPAFQSPDARLEALAEGERGGSRRGRGRVRAVLVVCEIALALVVLIGAGLVIRSLARLQAVEVGVGVEDALVVRFTVPDARYPEPAQVETFLEELRRRVAELPAVEAAGLGMAVPPNRLAMTNPYTPEGSPPVPGQAPPLAEELLITPGYLASLGIPVVAGRDFTDADREGAPPVALVNETLARRHFPGGAVGRWLQTGEPDPESPKLTIVGVVADVKYDGPDADPAPTVYVPYAQHLWWRNLYLVVSAPGDPYRQLEPVRAEIAALDPQIPLQEVTTLRRLGRDSVSQPRFQAFLLGSFGLVGLLLATAGIYGLVAYTVQQRRRDTAIRLALGARPARVVGAVLVFGLRLAAAGVVLGIGGALLASRLISGVLFGVEAIDPLTFAAMASFLVAVTLAACLAPARRAARTDPMRVLRSE